MTDSRSSLQFLAVGWFSTVMGLSGLALAWHRGAAQLGEPAIAVSVALAILAAVVFATLLAATAVRARRHPLALREDLQHPVRHAFVAAVPISALLLVTLWVSLVGASPLVEAFWWLASLAQLAVTLWVLTRWWKGSQPGGLVWASITPALIVPIVGNILVPLAGVPLGHLSSSAAQFGIGLLFWPVVLILLLVRIAVAGLWPERMMPTIFIAIAPPAVIGMDALQFGAPPLVAWGAWGIALFFLLWGLTQARRIAALEFGVAHWAMSFPLAAFTALTLRLAAPENGGGPVMGVLALFALAATSVVVLGLVLGTVRGLRQGRLLVPEPAATAPQPAASGGQSR
ncbi:MAG: C4-dicarboxylate ABC transporter [Burkholderiales bacterium]|nr:MAG: C4-dicarboxylate ABC transporter [Burkholderiales bacterium]